MNESELVKIKFVPRFAFISINFGLELIEHEENWGKSLTNYGCFIGGALSRIFAYFTKLARGMKRDFFFVF